MTVTMTVTVTKNNVQCPSFNLIKVSKQMFQITILSKYFICGKISKVRIPLSIM